MSHHTVRAAARCSAAGLMAAGLTVGAVSAASAAPEAPSDPQPAHLSIDGTMQIAPGVNVLTIDATGTRTEDGTTSGTYKATVQMGSSSTPFTVTGPVTCIDVGGDSASLVYPISGFTGSTLPGPLKDALAVQVSVNAGADGNMVGLSAPMPADSFDGCAPGPTPFPFEGTIETG